MHKDYEAIVMGVSAGGFDLLTKIIPQLPKNASLPLMIVQHLPADSGDYLVHHLDKISEITVKEAEEKETIQAGKVYIAPSDFHFLVEDDRTVTLSEDPEVNYSRPSVDVLFESAADVYRDKLIGIILTGSNSDGSVGLRKIKEYGGLAVVQEPNTAESKQMPLEAIRICTVDLILNPDEIADFLIKKMLG